VKELHNITQLSLSNQRTVLLYIKNHETVSKRELQTATHLSWGSVSAITSGLEKAGFIVPAGKQDSSAGRKPEGYSVNPTDKFVVGIDLNLTGISAAVCTLAGNPVYQIFRHIVYRTRESVMESLYEVVDNLLSWVGCRSLLAAGFAVQGFVDEKQGVSNHIPEVEDWLDVPLKALFEVRLKVPVYVIHDPNCVLAAEKYLPSGSIGGSENAVLLRIDTGVGMGIMLDGRVYVGAQSRSGELGHICVETRGAKCLCGNLGCLQEYATTGGLVRRFYEEKNRGTPSSLSDRTDLTVTDLENAAREGDMLCRALFVKLGTCLGIAISHIFNMLDVETVVLFGRLTDSRELYEDVMTESLRSHIYAREKLELRFSALKNEAVAVGAAYIASAKFITDHFTLDVYQ